MQTVYVNGKFTAQATTGVQRVAVACSRAVDLRLADEADEHAPRWVLLHPPGGEAAAAAPDRGARRSAPGRAACTSGSNGSLPRAARDGLLLNLTGSAPAWARQQVCTLHDAAVFDRPEAYTPLFRGWYRWLFRRLARTAVAAQSRSRRFRRPRLVERLGVPGERINVIHNGGDHLLHVQADPGYLALGGPAPAGVSCSRSAARTSPRTSAR